MNNEEPESYFGIIEIGHVYNRNTNADHRAEEDGEVFIPLEERNTRVVHYPDCQQLITWLTHPGRDYHNIRLIDNRTGSVVEEFPVSDKLNGSIQVLWDTLTIKPGSYTIEINWKQGWQHCIDLVKYKEGEAPPPVITAPVASESEKEMESPIQYRDGTGKILVDEDLLLRAKLLHDIGDRFRKITYEGTFRAGTIIYSDPEIRLELWHEMGGGNCMFYINIPGEEAWEKQTGIALASRGPLLEYIAERVRREQASNTRYEISNDSITYYYK